jgi:hypothetical protein
MAIVYRHIRLDKNEPFYIGIGENLERAHTKRSRNKYWKHIVKSNPYEVQILFDDLTWDEACNKEIEFIKLYGRKDLGTGILVNMTNGGDTPPSHKGKVRSEEFRKKCSESNKGRKLSEEHRKKLSESHKGYVATEQQRKKLSETNKGRKLSEEWKQKISESNKGKKFSEERIQKLKDNHKGMIGKKQSEETKRKISEAIKKKYQENPNYNKKA